MEEQIRLGGKSGRKSVRRIVQSVKERPIKEEGESIRRIAD